MINYFRNKFKKKTPSLSKVDLKNIKSSYQLVEFGETGKYGIRRKTGHYSYEYLDRKPGEDQWWSARDNVKRHCVFREQEALSRLSKLICEEEEYNMMVKAFNNPRVVWNGTKDSSV